MHCVTWLTPPLPRWVRDSLSISFSSSGCHGTVATTVVGDSPVSEKYHGYC